jgi:hypothetical protein
MEGITKAVAAGGDDFLNQIKTNPGVMNTWNPLYNFNAEQQNYLQKLAEYQMTLPPEKRGYIPPEFKIRLAYLNGKGEQIKQETEAVLPQDRLAVRAAYDRTFGSVLTDDLIKGKTPEGQAAAINFSGPMTIEQAADATKGLLYSNMGGRGWTSNFDVTAAQAQDRVDQILAASAEVAITKMDVLPEQKQALIDRALQTYVNYKAAEHAVVDAGADAAFAAVGVITFIPAVAGALETGGASLYAWGAGMAALGAVMRPGVKALLMNGEYDWRQNLLKDASIGAIEMPTYVLGPGLLLRATKAFAEPAMATIKALRLAGNTEVDSLIIQRFTGAMEQASKLVTSAGSDIVSGIKISTSFKGLTANALETAVSESTEAATRKAFTDVFSRISSQLKSAGGKPFSSESIELAAKNFSEEVLPKVLDDIGANLAGKSPEQIQALVQESIKKIIGQMSERGAFSAEAVIKALATAETESALANVVNIAQRQAFARNTDVTEASLIKLLSEVTDDPARVALLTQAIRAEIPHTTQMTSKNLMDLFIKTHPQFARALAYTAPAGLAGAASAPVRYEWDPTVTFEENMSRMGQQAMYGALISMAMVGAFTVPGSIWKSIKSPVKGFGVEPSKLRTIETGLETRFLGKLEDGTGIRLHDGTSVRVVSAGTPDATGFTVTAQNVKSTIRFEGGNAHIVPDVDSTVPAQIFRNGKWENLAPDEALQHGQMIRFGQNGESMVFMRAAEAGKDSAFFLPVPKLDPKVTNRVIPAVVEEAGFQPGTRLRVTPGRNVATIGGDAADVRLWRPDSGSTHMVEASMPVADTRSLFTRLLRRGTDDVAPLATKGEVNLRNTGDSLVTVIRKDAKGNVVGTDVYPSLSSLQADARRLGNAVPTEAPKFPVGQHDEVILGLKKFTAYSQNGAIRLERLADAGSTIPVERSLVATVLRASADDMGRVERVINAVRNQGSDIFESTRGIYNRVAEGIRSGELLDRLRNGDVLGRVLHNSNFEKAATLTDKRLISLGFAKIETPIGVTGSIFRNYKTGVEIVRHGDRVVQVTANGRVLKINWNAVTNKVESMVMPDGTLREVVPRGGKFNAPSLAELAPVEEGKIRLYRATFSPTNADLATPLTARETQRLATITKQIEEKGMDSLSPIQRIQYSNLKPYLEAANARKFYTSLDEALEAAGKGDKGVRPTILVYDDLVSPSHIAGGVDLPAELALKAKQHPLSFTNTLNDGTWMASIAEASAVTHYGAQVVRDVGFRINANGFSFLRGFSDAGMLARARSIVDQAMSRVTRGIASKTGFSHLINMGERIDIGTAFGSEILSKNKYVAGRTASLLKTKDGLKLIAGDGDVIVIRNGVPVVLKNGEAVLQSGDRIIAGKALGQGLYKGDEFVVALDSTKSVLQHTRTANNLGYLYSGPGGRVPTGLLAKVVARNLSTAAVAAFKMVPRAISTVWNVGKQSFELFRHIRAAMKEGRINRGLQNGKEYTIFGTGRLSREGNQITLRQLKEPLYIVRSKGDKTATFMSNPDKPVKLQAGDLIYRGKTPEGKLVGQAFEYRGLPVKAERVPLRERVGNAYETVRGLHLKDAVVDRIRKFGAIFSRTPKVPVEGAMTWRERIRAAVDPIRTAQAKMAAFDASVPRAPLTEIERAKANLLAAIKAEGLGEPVQAFRVRISDAKAKPVALSKEGTAISFAARTDDAASDLVPTFKPLKDASGSEAQVVIKNENGRRLVTVSKDSELKVSVKSPGRDAVPVTEKAHWQEGDSLLVTRNGKTTTLEFERSSAYGRVVEQMTELRANVGREGLLKSVWANATNWWNTSRKYASSFRRRAAAEGDVVAGKVKTIYPKKDNIKIDSSTNVKIVKIEDGSKVRGEISTTGELWVKRAGQEYTRETSGKASLLPGERFRIGEKGDENLFTGIAVERTRIKAKAAVVKGNTPHVKVKEKILRRGGILDAIRTLRNSEHAQVNILNRASDVAGDAADGVAPFYRVKFTPDSKPVVFTSDARLGGIFLPSLKYSREPLAVGHLKFDGKRVSALQLEVKSDKVKFFLTDAEGSVMTRISAPTDLPEGAFLRTGNELFEVKRVGDDLILEQVQSTKLTQNMMRQQPGSGIELIEKPFVQSNRVKAAQKADAWEVKGSGGTAHEFSDGSVILGADHVAVINKSETANFAPRQARVSFEPEGTFVEALTERPVYLLSKNEAGEEVATVVKQGQKIKFDPETQSVRLGDDSNNGRSVFNFKQKEEVKASPVAARTAPEGDVVPTKSAAPDEFRGPRVAKETTDAIPATGAATRDAASNLPLEVVKDNLRKEVGAIFKAQGLDSALIDVEAALKNALAKINYEKVTPLQIKRELNAIFRDLSIELRFQASVHDKTIIIKTLKEGAISEFALAAVVGKVEPNSSTLNKIAKQTMSVVRRDQFHGAEYNPEALFSGLSNTIKLMSGHGEPEQIVRALNRELKQYGFHNRIAIKFEEGQFKINILQKGTVDPDVKFLTFDSTLRARVADVDTILPSATRFEQTTAEHLDRFSSELNRIAKADFAGDPAALDAFRFVDDMITDFKANPTLGDAFELERLANEVFESRGLSARFSIEYDSMSGRLALFDKEKPPLIKFVDQIFDPPPASLPRSLEAIQQDATIAARQAMVEKERELQAMLLAIADSGSLRDLDAVMTQMRALAPDHDGGVLDMVERANRTLSENGVGHKARFEINGENELSVFVRDPKLPIAEVNLLRTAVKADVVSDLRPRAFDIENSAEQLVRLRSELDRVAKADGVPQTTQDALASVSKLVDDFKANPSPEAASALVARANQMLDSSAVGNRFKFSYDANTGKLALFDNEVAPLGHITDVKLELKQADLFDEDSFLRRSPDQIKVSTAKADDFNAKLIEYANSGTVSDFNSMVAALRTLVADQGANSSNIAQHVSRILRNNNDAGRRLRFNIKGDDEISIYRIDSSRPVIEIDLLNPTIRSSTVADMVPDSIPAGALSVKAKGEALTLLNDPAAIVTPFTYGDNLRAFRVEDKLYRLDSVSNLLVEIPGGAKILRDTLTQDLSSRLASINATISIESIRKQLQAVLGGIDYAAVNPELLYDISLLAKRSWLPLEDLQAFYMGLLKQNRMGPGMRRAVTEAVGDLQNIIASRQLEVTSLLSKESVNSSVLARVAIQNSDNYSMTDDMAKSFIALAHKNMANISSADATTISNFIEQAAKKFATLKNDAQFVELQTRLKAQNTLLQFMKRLAKSSPTTESRLRLKEGPPDSSYDLLDDASLIELAAAVKKGHMTPENSSRILEAIAARKAIRPFGAEAENAFASAHLEYVAKSLGVTTEFPAVLGGLASVLKAEK